VKFDGLASALIVKIYALDLQCYVTALKAKEATRAAVREVDQPTAASAGCAEGIVTYAGVPPAPVQLRPGEAGRSRCRHERPPCHAGLTAGDDVTSRVVAPDLTNLVWSEHWSRPLTEFQHSANATDAISNASEPAETSTHLHEEQISLRSIRTLSSPRRCFWV